MPFIELVAQRRSPTPPPGMQPPENAKDWFRIENNADDSETTDIYVYESIGGWFGMWAEDFIYQLKQVGTSKINLRLNSPGGSVFDGIAIANALRAHPATVTVYVDSLAASIASVIALAGDRVVMMPQSQFMVHNASGACYGDATEMTKMADLLDKQSLNIAQAYAQHTGRPLAEWQQYMADETWFTAEEALAVGLADEVMPMRPEKSDEECEPMPASASALMNRTWDLSMYRYAGREQAPAPQAKVIPGQRITAAVLNGVDITGDIKDVTPALEPEAIPGAEPGTITVDFSQWMTPDKLTEMIRDAVRAELAAQTSEEPAAEPEASTPPPIEEAPAEPEAPAPEDASKPAFLQPDEDEEEDEESPPDEEDEPEDTADEWDSIVGLLSEPATSPSADDVFAHLKEVW